MRRAVRCDLPATSALLEHLPRVDHIDGFAIASTREDLNMVQLYAALWGHLPEAFRHLLVLRSALVKPLGIAGVSYRDLTGAIDTSKPYRPGDKIGRWTLCAQRDDELIVGADDKHLDFRVSLLSERGKRVVISTGIMTHNTFGKAYLASILPFHRFGVAALLTNAAREQRI